MQLDFEGVLEDWREGVCARCGRECLPHYRFCYSAKKTDIHRNPLIDFEVEFCRYCCGKVEKDWKTKCRDEPCLASEVKLPEKR